MVNESWDVIDEFDARYRIAGESVARRIEVKTIGSDYGASSYTTRDQADRLASLLALAPGRTLLDVGSGAGWPGIYLARTTGCDVFLADLPPEGLRRAHRRMLDEGVRGVVVAAAGAELPLRDEALDAATSSDVLCWLPDKLSVLRACRRVLKKDAPLAFFVVAVADGLSVRQIERGIEAGPPHADAGPGYGLLLREAGFSDIELVDVTDEYADTLTKSILVRESEANQLVDLIGEDMFTESQARRRSELDAVHSGILRRHLVSAVRPWS